MPYAHHHRKLKQKEYRDRNKEKIKIKNQNYYIENKVKLTPKKKQYYEENREAILKEARENYDETKEQNHKTFTLRRWQKNGIEDEDFDLLYDVFIKETNCWICNKEFNKIKGYDFKCLDHNHATGEARYICCGYCNLHIVG